MPQFPNVWLQHDSVSAQKTATVKKYLMEEFGVTNNRGVASLFT